MTATDNQLGLGRRVVTRLRSLAPGLVVVAIGTAMAFVVNSLVPAVSALTVAVVLGIMPCSMQARS